MNNREIKFRYKVWDKETRYILKKAKGRFRFPNSEGIIIEKYGSGQKDILTIDFYGNIRESIYNGITNTWEQVNELNEDLVLINLDNTKEMYQELKNDRGDDSGKFENPELS